MENRSEEEIRRKKDKKLQKHFDILIDNQKVKIIKFLFRIRKKLDIKIEVITLISKHPFQNSNKEIVDIFIETDKSSIEIKGKWHSSVSSVGVHDIEYQIIEKTETLKTKTLS